MIMAENSGNNCERSQIFTASSAQECRYVDVLKARAQELGLDSNFVGDKRKRETWEALLESHKEAKPVKPQFVVKPNQP
jgi:3-deoxy-D-manno-octulosonate 8-phosphate phosphatase KdsC-like HAD superfamily phosphatase